LTGADVSVVIPARNEEARLPECLARLREQSLPGFEIIVVDSASADRTSAVAHALGVRVVRLEQPGVGLARQAGFDAASRRIIVSTDADALPSRDWIERLVEPFRDSATVCSFGTIRLSGAGALVAIGHSLFRAFQRVNLLLGRPICCGPNFAVRKSAFHSVGGFAVGQTYPNEAEDVRLALKLRSVGRIVFLHDLAMDVSARSLAGGQALKYIAHHTGVYFRVCWLHRELAPSR
jgi:glycosyltransferase involved in cell wall biosynthesis